MQSVDGSAPAQHVLDFPAGQIGEARTRLFEWRHDSRLRNRRAAVAAYDVAPGGHQFVMHHDPEAGGQLVVILGWSRELRDLLQGGK